MAASEPLAATALQLKRIFQASREKVYGAWIEPDAMKKWFAPSEEFSIPTVEVDLRVGGKYRIDMQAPNGNHHVATGIYREIQPPRKLVFTWVWEDRGMPETLVTVEFHERGNATEVVLTHERFANAEERDRHQQGWTGCLARLPNAL